MVDRSDSDVLAQGTAGARPGGEGLYRMVAHPRFGEAARALARNMLTTIDEDPVMSGAFKDAGRYVAALLAFYLGVTTGLTLPALKGACARSQLLSPGRTRALLYYLCHVGYFEQSSGPARGIPAGYRPTDRFVTVWREQIRQALEAARIVAPEAGILADRIGQPGMIEAFARVHGEVLLTDSAAADVTAPFVRVFMSRHAGSQLIWQLVTPAGENGFPPEQAHPFSVAVAARRFGVSRIHLQRMIDDACEEGLVSVPGPGLLVLEQPIHPYLRYHYAWQLSTLVVCSARTLGQTAGEATA